MSYFQITNEDLAPDDRDVIPKGRYTAIVSKAQWKNGRQPGARYVELEITLQGPSHAGRKVWDRLNLENPNPDAVSIARRSAAALCVAVGLGGFADPSELCDKMFEVNIGIEKDKTGQYPDKNRVASYVKPETAVRPAAAVTPPPKAGPPRVSGTGSSDRGWQP